MLKRVACLEDEKILYEYFRKITPGIPNYSCFPVDFATWRKSMFNENDESGPRFCELETYLLYEENILKGFIQYGLTNYIWGEIGLDYTKHYALIRNMHYAKDTRNPDELMEAALNYFKENETKFMYLTEQPSRHMNEITAYFHGFGMQCYAMHTKLHESQFYIEELLDKYSFINNEKNIYYSKDLNNCDVFNDSEIECRVETKKHIHVTFFLQNEEIGSCSLEVVQEKLYWMWWFGINEEYQKRGLGTRCLNNIFCILKEKNAEKVGTDTWAENYAAQALYRKTGFTNMGITKSYKKEFK